MHIPRIQIYATFEADADSEYVSSPDGDEFYRTHGSLDLQLGGDVLSMHDDVEVDLDSPLLAGQSVTFTAREDPETFTFTRIDDHTVVVD